MFAPHRIAAALVPLVMVMTPGAAASLTDRATAEGDGAAMVEGPSVALDGGEIASFAEFDADGAPRAIGIRIDGTVFEALPHERNATSRCFDLDSSGSIEAEVECEGDTEVRIVLPDEVAERDDIPFKWAMVNWQPHGHPPEPWAVRHFDIHFYMIPQEKLDAIALGPCDFFIDCEAQERALRPVPPEFLHQDYADVGAVVGLMGNHLIDTKTPELVDPATPFTHTWIYGAYDGSIIFQEVMVTEAFLQSKESGCHPIKLPRAWQAGGWYPTSYCIEYDAEDDAHVVAMSDFVLRPASTAVSMVEPDEED